MYRAIIALIAVLGLALAQADGTPPGPPPDGAPPGNSNANVEIVASKTGLLQDGGTSSQTALSLVSSGNDESAIVVKNGGNLTLSGAKINKTGDTSSDDDSSFFALNGAVVVQAGSKLTLSDSSVSTNGTGTNGVFATGKEASIQLANVNINANGDGAHGVDATLEGTLDLQNVNITTSGAHGAALATDRGSGTITAKGGTIKTTGQDSPDIYSTGKISVSGLEASATISEAVVIEGSNSVSVTDSNLSGANNGVMMYQSFSGDAEGQDSVFKMTGGSLSTSKGALFFITNTNAEIYLSKVKVSSTSGVLINAAATTRWGKTGSNGGHVTLVADNEELSGNIAADSISSIALTLKNSSSLSGGITSAALSLDASSRWNVTADSALTALEGAQISGNATLNIVGNGHSVTYDKSLAANSYLGGKTYTLAGGGTLSPR